MRRKKISLLNIWPGFVDAISTLLLVFIFLLAVLMISENFLTQAITGKNNILDQLRSKVLSLELNLKNTKEEKLSLSELINNLTQQLNRLNLEKENLSQSLLNEKNKNSNLSIDIIDLEKKVSNLVEQIGIEEMRVSVQEKKALTYRNTIDTLNNNISELNNKIQKIQIVLEKSNEKLENKNIEIKNLGAKLNDALTKKVGELQEYRSEFFGRLKSIIGKEKEINIVGDRFVLQSEVFFESGSAKIQSSGVVKVKEITKILKSISKKIPKNIDWIIQVEGHTDNIPISTIEFPSNWELSTSRAIAVAKIMMDNGIPSDKITVAGYGEYKPLVSNKNAKNREKNRRIELKLTQP